MPVDGHLFEDVWSKPPDFVNEKGVKWWLDVSSTRYALSVDALGRKLKNVQVYFTEFPDGERSRVIIDNGEAVYETKTLENLGTQLDLMKATKNWK
jgi:hypothetical protein